MADVRGIGLIGGIELVAQGAPGEAGMKAFQSLWKYGVLARVTGDTLAFAPPLIIETNHVEIIREALEKVLARQYNW